MENRQQGISVDLKNTQMISDKDGEVIFTPGYLLRKLSKFVTGESEDSVIPIQVWVNSSTGKVSEAGLPDYIIEELKELDKI